MRTMIARGASREKANLSNCQSVGGSYLTRPFQERCLTSFRAKTCGVMVNFADDFQCVGFFNSR